MRWHNERINAAVQGLHVSLVHDLVLIDLLRRMRDDYERALLDQRAESIKLAQQVAELQAAHDARGLGVLALAESRGEVIATLIDERIALGRRIFELEQQLAAALATVERAVVAPEADDTGALYAEGCAP